MSDCLTDELLRGVTERTLSTGALARVFQHLASCDACRERLNTRMRSLDKTPVTVSPAKTLGVEVGAPIAQTASDTSAIRENGATIAEQKTIAVDIHESPIPSPKTASEFERNVTVSGLITKEEMTAFMEGLSPDERPQDAAAIADLLVRHQRLTSYQAAILSGGKTRGLILGNYEVLEKIGEGGMGMVFKARHRRMKRIVAVKILPPHLTSSKDAIHRFHREVEVAAKLTHPNISAAFDADEADGIHFLVMEYVDGPSLAAYVRQAGPLAVPVAINLTLQAARGLTHAHANGVIHRDIKPSNLLVNQEGVLKVLDMGLARIDDSELESPRSELTQSGRVMGTVDYMAPEQAIDAKYVDHRADIYSLGCTLHYLLTGKSLSPDGALTQKLLWHQNQAVPSLRMDRPDVPEALDLAFQQMLEKKAEKRQANMAEVCRQLEAVLAELPHQDLQLTMVGIDLHVLAPMTDRGSMRGEKTTRVESPTRTYLPDEIGSLRPIAAEPTATKKKVHPAIVAMGAGAVLFVVLLAVLAAGTGKQKERPMAVLPPKNQKAPETPSPPIEPVDSGEMSPAPAKQGVKQLENEVTPPSTVVETPLPHEKMLRWLFQNNAKATLVLDDGQAVEVDLLKEVPHKSFELTGVNLEGTGVRDDELAQLASAAKSIQQLSLAKVKLGETALDHVAVLTQLRNLNLAHTPVTNDGLAKLSRLGELRELNLHGTLVTDQGLSQLVGLNRLEKLFLTDTQVGDAGIQKLAELKSLAVLGMNGTYLTEEGYEGILAALPRLTVNWDGRDLERKAAKRLLAKRATLELSTRSGSDVKRVVESATLPRERFWITGVDYGSNPMVVDTDLKQLAELAKVVSLKLGGTRVSAQGLANLYGLKSLREVDLGSLAVSKAAVDGLQNALPDCRIEQKPSGDLLVANLVLSRNGAVTVTTSDGDTLSRIKASDALPQGAFVLQGIHWEGSSLLEDDDLGKLQDLGSLEVLELERTKISNQGMALLNGCRAIRYLSLSNTKVSSEGLAYLARFPELQRLYLANTAVDGMGLRHVAKIDGLTHLSLAGTTIRDDELVSLKRLTKLQRLILTDVPLTDNSLDVLKSFQGLKELLVNGTQITDAGAEELAKSLTGCTVKANPPDPGRSLTLWVLSQGGSVKLDTGEIKKVSQTPRDVCRVKSVDLGDLPNVRGDILAEKIRGVTTLEELDLSGTSVTNVHMSGLANSAGLKHLLLSRASISDAGLSNLKGMTQLVTLDLRGTRVAGPAFAELADLSRLESLYLGNSQISDRHLQLLATYENLVNLDFSANSQVTDKGLAELKPLAKLQKLGLRGTRVSDAAMTTVAGFKELQLLDLESTSVGDDGAGRLKELRMLRSLNLNKTQITDGALSVLAGMPQLRYVNLSRTKVTDGAVQTLKLALPDCQIVKSAAAGPKDPDTGGGGGPFGGFGQ